MAGFTRAAFGWEPSAVPFETRGHGAMPRSEVITRSSRRSAQCEVEVSESFTLRCDTPDGRVLRSDGEGLWRQDGAGSWRGMPPKGWDESKAYPEAFSYSYEMELDYS